jgi:hypothetical protein
MSETEARGLTIQQWNALNKVWAKIETDRDGREDIRTARIMCHISNTFRGPGTSPHQISEFIPKPKEGPKTDPDKSLEAKIFTMNAIWNADNSRK